MEQATKKPPATFTDFLRARFKTTIEPIARFLNRTGLKPNTVTLLGLFGTAVGSFFLARGQMTLGGLIILVMAPVDALDGTMARLRGMPSRFGGFVDSVSDRYSELLIFGGLLFYFIQADNVLGVTLTYLAAAGSILVSYIRARAEFAGYGTKVGVLTRVERFIVLIPCLILNIPIYAVGIIALLANLTALQRILDVRKQAHEQKDILQD
jgi:CDP-diacylglycerol---glycerol-3-phosphate 3-phosphatidyltransferase